MSLPAIRAAIVARLSAVANVGRVHDYERYAANEKAFRDLYLSAGKILGWHLHRSSRHQQREGVLLTVLNGWEIRGFMALEDATTSGVIFDDLVEAIVEVFNASPSLGGVAEIYNGSDQTGLQLVKSAPVLFAGVLCHSATLGLVTRHFSTS